MPEDTHAHPDVNRVRRGTADDRGVEADVVIDLTDATMNRTGGPAVTLGDSPVVAAAGSLALDRDTRAAPRGALAALMGSPLALLVVINALNVADATLTVLWIEMGIALEANPIVDAMGFPAKVAVVAVGSYVVFRLRPRWLIVPIVALALVCVYHLVGAAAVLSGVL